MSRDIKMVVSSKIIEKKIKKWRKKKMIQIFEKAVLEEFVEEEVFIVIPEKKIKVETKEEQKPHKKSKLLKRHKKKINIHNVKTNPYTKTYTNKFMIR